MKKRILGLLLLVFTSPALMISCGGDSGGGGGDKTSSKPSDDENNDNENENDSGGGSSCLTTSERNNITTLFDRLSSDGTMTGDTTATVFNPDGTTNEGTFNATAFSFGRATSSSWAIGYAICTSADNCRSSSNTAVFQNGCFFINGAQANISSSSPSSLTYSTMNGGVRIQSSYSLPSSGIFRYTESYSENGRRTLRFVFVEHSTTVASDDLFEMLRLNLGGEANMSEVVPTH